MCVYKRNTAKSEFIVMQIDTWVKVCMWHNFTLLYNSTKVLTVLFDDIIISSFQFTSFAKLLLAPGLSYLTARGVGHLRILSVDKETQSEQQLCSQHTARWRWAWEPPEKENPL